MPQYTPLEVFQFAIAGGFTPDQAVTMTAIAFAESGGVGEATAVAAQEESVGLWQINLKAHAATVEANGWDLTDPVDNARAAFMVSGGGSTINPWTVTHHQPGEDARYLTFVDVAQDAAAEAGYPGLTVNVAGTDGYDGADIPASADDVPTGLDPAHPIGVPDHGVPAIEGLHQWSDDAAAYVHQADEGIPIGEFLRKALAQEGDRYVLGANPDPNDPDPDVFDCAELIQWSLEQVGAPNPGGSTNEQNYWLRDPSHGAIEVPIELAKEIPGAVIYSYSASRAAAGEGQYAGHVAISLGNGETIEARGSKWGVGSWEIGNRFEKAFLLPGLDYGDLAGLDGGELGDLTDGLQLATLNAGGMDSDHDLLADHFEMLYGTDPHNPDMDGDGITDGYELMVLGTDAMNVDSDYDGLPDDIELVLGFDPTVADNPDPDSAHIFAPDEWVDSDGDGITDWFERTLGFDPDDADSDDDGVIDGLEVVHSHAHHGTLDDHFDDGPGGGDLDGPPPAHVIDLPDDGPDDLDNS